MKHRHVFCVDILIFYWTVSVRVEHRQWMNLRWFYVSYSFDIWKSLSNKTQWTNTFLKWDLHEMICHHLQAWRELMKNWSISIWLLILSRNPISDLKIMIWRGKSLKSSVPIKFHPQYIVCNHMGDLKNVFLDPQTWYGQTLLGSDQSGNDVEKATVKMSL